MREVCLYCVLLVKHPLTVYFDKFLLRKKFEDFISLRLASSLNMNLSAKSLSLVET